MHIARIFNIDIVINIFLIPVIGLVILFGNGKEFAAIFLILVIHEIGHVVMARFLRLNVREIELLPFGGMVRIESIFELNPSNEIIIAAAGPVVNLLAILIYFLLIYTGVIPEGSESLFFIDANLLLAGFNLLPALPLDGGRILRAILSRQMGIKRATRIAATGGLILALFLAMTGIYALYYRVINYMLFIMAIFLVYSALKERKSAAYVLMRDITYKKESLLKEGSLPIREIVVLETLPLDAVIRRFVPQRYHYIKVVDEQLKEKGVLSESQIVGGLLTYSLNMPISRLLNRLG
jgi:stage IV sporulation protein FB